MPPYILQRRLRVSFVKQPSQSVCSICYTPAVKDTNSRLRTVHISAVAAGNVKMVTHYNHFLLLNIVSQLGASKFEASIYRSTVSGDQAFLPTLTFYVNFFFGLLFLRIEVLYQIGSTAGTCCREGNVSFSWCFNSVFLNLLHCASPSSGWNSHL